MCYIVLEQGGSFYPCVCISCSYIYLQVVVWPICGQNSQYTPMFPTGRETEGTRPLTQSTQAFSYLPTHFLSSGLLDSSTLCTGEAQPKRLSS